MQGLQSNLTPQVRFISIILERDFACHLFKDFLMCLCVLDAESGVGGPALSEPLVRGVRHACPPSGAAGAGQHRLPASCCKERLLKQHSQLEILTD